MRKTMDWRCAAATALMATAASAHPHEGEGDGHAHDGGWVHENGIGPDPDNDTNPATDTRVLAFMSERARLDPPPYAVISFEPPPGRHGETINDEYKSRGVVFGEGLSRQICIGQRRFRYDSQCTYAAPTSGDFAAVYVNHLNAPLRVEFDQPVCLVTLSIYPTGAKEGEVFEFAIAGFTEDGYPLDRSTKEFRWTNDVVRWRNLAGAYFVDRSAKTITVSMRSLDGAAGDETLRYLIDDFAFVSDGCDAALSDVEARTGLSFDIPEAPLVPPSDRSSPYEDEEEQEVYRVNRG